MALCILSMDQRVSAKKLHCNAMQYVFVTLTLRAKPTVKPPTPKPATRGFVSTPKVPNREKPAKVYTAMAAALDANLQFYHSGMSQAEHCSVHDFFIVKSDGCCRMHVVGLWSLCGICLLT